MTCLAGEFVAQSTPVAGMRILIVEDEPDLLASLAKALREEGYAVDTAPDGEEGLFDAECNEYDAVVLDVMLPKLDGWQLAKAIRHHSNGRRPFLIAMSGYGTPSDQARSQEAGIDLHLVKPVEPEALREVLRRFHTVIAPSTEIAG